MTEANSSQAELREALPNPAAVNRVSEYLRCMAVG
jgi:hypothetical protein